MRHYDFESREIREYPSKDVWRSLRACNILEPLPDNLEKILDELNNKAEDILNECFEKFKKRREEQYEEYRKSIDEYKELLGKAFDRLSKYYEKFYGTPREKEAKRQVSIVEKKRKEIIDKINLFEAIVRSYYATENLELEIKPIGCVYVLPEEMTRKALRKNTTDESDNIRKQIEIEAIKYVIEFERSNGRIPRDVSGENLGYDIISSGHSETRYIEVKGFKTCPREVEITANEWRVAEELGDKYWLYIVLNVLDPKKREILTIQNPYAKFHSKCAKLIKIKIDFEYILNFINNNSAH